MLAEGLKHAINYDGGGSTTMCTDRFGMINHPKDNEPFNHVGERNLRNVYVILSKYTAITTDTY